MVNRVLSSGEMPFYHVHRWIKALFLEKNRVKNVFYSAVNGCFCIFAAE